MSFIDDQEAAIRARAQDVALFRYRLIAPAIEPGLTGRQRGRLVRGIAAKAHAGPAGRRVQVSRKSLDRWIRAYRAGGFEALLPLARPCAPRTEASVLELAAALEEGESRPDRGAGSPDHRRARRVGAVGADLCSGTSCGRRSPRPGAGWCTAGSRPRPPTCCGPAMSCTAPVAAGPENLPVRVHRRPFAADRRVPVGVQRGQPAPGRGAQAGGRDPRRPGPAVCR